MRSYRLDQNRTPLFDAVKKFADWDPVPFFIPSHKMGEGIDPRFKSFAGDSIFKIDLSEVRWTDDFHAAASSIKEAQELAADAWGAAQSHFLVNGTSGGIIAAICSVAGEGDRVIVPRNAHKSAIYGLVISGAKPVYVMPEENDQLGLIGGLDPKRLERALEETPEAKAVFTVSPTYHGVMSDTAALSKIAHHYGAILIADEAHGNHVYFSDRLPKGALELGADIVCQSTHKMSGSLTQASILHLGKDAAGRVDFDRVNTNLRMIQTTSPSYILLASLDSARSYIATQGERLLDGVLDALEKARRDIAVIPGIETLPSNCEDKGADKGADKGDGPYCPARDNKDRPLCLQFYEPTRLVISARALGLGGYELFRVLREDYDIECEFADPVWCVCVAGLGTRAEHTEALTSALSVIARNCRAAAKQSASPCIGEGAILPPIPELRMTPRKAWFAEKENILFDDARGRVSAEMVAPYPPGIPVLCPGEVVSDEVHDFLAMNKRAGCHIHCTAGDSLKTLSVVKKS